MLWSIILKLEFSDSQLHYGFFPEIDWLENMPVVFLCKGTSVCLIKDLNIDTFHLNNVLQGSGIEI